MQYLRISNVNLKGLSLLSGRVLERKTYLFSFQKWKMFQRWLRADHWQYFIYLISCSCYYKYNNCNLEHHIYRAPNEFKQDNCLYFKPSSHVCLIKLLFFWIFFVRDFLWKTHKLLKVCSFFMVMTILSCHKFLCLPHQGKLVAIWKALFQSDQTQIK